MKRTIGGILSIVGLLGLIFYIFKFLNDSQSISAFGTDVTMSTGNWAPIIVSAILMVVGLLLYRWK